MFKVNDDLSIYVTRGDSASFTVTAVKDEEEYTFPAGSVVRLKVYERKGCECVVLQKDFPVAADSKSAEITLTEMDTRIGGLISKPKDYWYEIELNPFDNPETIIGYDEDGAKVFKLFPEGKDLEGEVLPEDIPVVDVELDMTSTRPVENQAIARKFATMEQRLTDADGKFEEIKNRFYATDDAIEGRLATTGGIITGNIAMSGKKVTNLGEPTAAEDAVNLKYANEHYAEKGHGHNVSDIGGFPTSMPASDVHEWAKAAKKPSYTATEVGARPNDWMPTAAQVGAVPTSRKVNGKTLSSDITLYASDVGARPSTWMPTASDVGARPNTWFPSANDIGAAPTGFGLGTGCVTIDRVKSITKNGWYLTQGDVPLAGAWFCNADCSVDAYNIIVDAYSADGKLHARLTKNGTWEEEWEWVNPPLNMDVEYKTTDRWYSYPVYVRMINMGALPNNSTKSYAISDHAGGGRIISAEGFENATGQKIPSNCFACDFTKVVDLPFSGLNLIIQTNFDGSAFTQALVTARYIKY